MLAESFAASRTGTATSGPISEPRSGRPGNWEMLGDIEAGRFQVVAVCKLDRSMRDTRLMLNAIEVLDRYSLRIVAEAPVLGGKAQLSRVFHPPPFCVPIPLTVCAFN